MRRARVAGAAAGSGAPDASMERAPVCSATVSPAKALIEPPRNDYDSSARGCNDCDSSAHLIEPPTSTNASCVLTETEPPVYAESESLTRTATSCGARTRCYSEC